MAASLRSKSLAAPVNGASGGGPTCVAVRPVPGVGRLSARHAMLGIYRNSSAAVRAKLPVVSVVVLLRGYLWVAMAVYLSLRCC